MKSKSDNLTPAEAIAELLNSLSTIKKHETDLEKIFRLRKEKKFDEAYELALRKYRDPSNTNSKFIGWIHKAYAWVLIDKIKNLNIKESLTFFKELLNLDTIKDDDLINKQILKLCNNKELINSFIVTYIKTDIFLILKIILNLDDINYLNVKNRQYMAFFTQLEGNISYDSKILLIKKMFYFKANNNFNFSIEEFLFFIEKNRLTPVEYTSFESNNNSIFNDDSNDGTSIQPLIDSPSYSIVEMLENLKVTNNTPKIKPPIQDLSIEAIHEFLKSFLQGENAFIPYQVLTYFCKSIRNPKIQFEIKYFFEKCDGLIKINWKQVCDEEQVFHWVIDQGNPLKTYEKPTDIIFCEGIKSNKLDFNLNQEFWWCMKEPCFGCTIKGQRSWQDYTIIDFLNIFGYAINENEYIKFVHFLNRFERLKKHIYCYECGEIMYPVSISIDTKNAVTQFHCVNKLCSKESQIIYLNDCLNSRCNQIIDSRTSKKCPNGWYICKICGSCCSHAVFANNLKFWQKKTNVKDNAVFVPQFLLDAVQKKLGHLEKAEYYCSKCGQMMIEREEDIYECVDCNIQYNTQRFKLKKIRIHKDIRRKDYKVIPFPRSHSLSGNEY